MLSICIDLPIPTRSAPIKRRSIHRYGQRNLAICKALNSTGECAYLRIQTLVYLFTHDILKRQPKDDGRDNKRCRDEETRKQQQSFRQRFR